MTIATIPIDEIIAESDTQARAREDAETVEEYAVVMRDDPDAMPPVVVYRDAGGTYLADGFHRLAAARLAGLTEIRAQVHAGGRADARLAACAANATHGLRRTNADKRRAVETCLGLRPDWSDRQIARHCGVDHKTVGKCRAGWGTSPRLAESEERIASAICVACALKEIRDRRLYRDTHPTFKAYCLERWGMTPADLQWIDIIARPESCAAVGWSDGGAA